MAKVEDEDQRGAAKRFSRLPATVLRHKAAFKSHILTKMSTKRKRNFGVLPSCTLLMCKKRAQLRLLKSKVEDIKGMARC